MINPRLKSLMEAVSMENIVIPETNRPDNGAEEEFIPVDLENPQDYVRVPGVNIGLFGNPVVISKFEVQGLNNMNYENTHKKVFKDYKGLYIPPPSIFMSHFKNVVENYKNNGYLVDAEGNQISREEHEEIYKHLTTNFKAVYGSQPGAWTWLNARFVSGDDGNLDLETIIGIKPDGTFETKKEPLLSCLDEDTYAEIEFNAQGLLTQKSPEEDYKQGENIYFLKPVNGRVARFYAGSGWADLVCFRVPSYSGSALGVFLCAEGAR